MTQLNRISGGQINRSQELNFSFDGKKFTGYQGDTLASALLANGQILVARSFKYHRPRGIFTAGSEEPNALVEVRRGAYLEPNTRATTTQLYDGLVARSQNYLGTLKFDLMALNDVFAPFLGAGFYYKTFMWPKSFWEKLYEPIIRSSAGLGRLSGEPDPDNYDKKYLHCDILIIGSGPAGLSAALTAGRSGARVVLAEEDFILGGRLNAEKYEISGHSASEWKKQVIAELETIKNVQIMPRTTIFGVYDHGIYGGLERRTEHLFSSDGKTRQVLWRIYCRRSILCAGSIERPIAFGNNDRPGVILAGAVRTYINRWGVTPGKKVAIFTNNDSGWQTALDLKAKGVFIAVVIDSRNISPPVKLTAARVIMGEKVINTKGRHGISSVNLSNGEHIPTDCLALSGGWNPNLSLTCHHGTRPTWRDDICAFVPGKDVPDSMLVAGSAGGTMTLGAVLDEGHRAGNFSAKELGYSAIEAATFITDDEKSEISPLWFVKESKARAWLDFQNDVTVKDLKLSYQEGFRSVEHLKRYTTLGMATDQGKTANILGLALMADYTGKSISDTGTTMFRPPYTPVSIGAFAGKSRGKNFRPYRLTPSHDWATEQGAIFVETGAWLRAQWYPQLGESHWRESVDREVLQTRASVGVCDVTTLGKIDIQGNDAAEFLNNVYANGFAKLQVGKVRYGLMLREDGIAMDDGTTAHLSDNHYLMTTTTANAVNVFRHLEFCRQCLWPLMDVHIISATEQYAQFAVAGPNSRKLLQKIIDNEFDISNEEFPYMACGSMTICEGKPARLFRISFSGELGYEIAVPARFGDAMIRVLVEAGEEFNVVPYGTEALGVMRVEKGHAAGNELTGQTTARDLGMPRMVSQKKDSIGKVLSERDGLNREDGFNLMGFLPVDRKDILKAGAHFVSLANKVEMKNDEGWVSSAVHSPTFGHSIALGFIERGQERIGEIVRAADPLRGTDIEVEIVSPHFYDPDGERLRV